MPIVTGDHRRGNSRTELTLGRYVMARNGAPLGGKGSMRNMLHRSLGAASFAGFWRYWNPIWSYYLGRYIYRPVHRVLPRSVALLLTFLVSGVIHDLVTTAVRGSWTLFFVPWFGLMGFGVLASQRLGMDLSARPWIFRAAVNLLYLGAGFWLAMQVRV